MGFEAQDSAAYLLILTYDRSSAAADHMTISHFTIAIINPVPNIGKSMRLNAILTLQSEQPWSLSIYSASCVMVSATIRPRHIRP